MISEKLLPPSVEYMVLPAVEQIKLPVAEMAMPCTLPETMVDQVAPPSLVRIRPLLVAAYRVFASVGCASMSATDAQFAVPELG
jgi:hypothetical protein